MLLSIAVLILGFNHSAHAQDSDKQLEIDAAEISSENGTEFFADNAILKYGNIQLQASKLRYDIEGGWTEAYDGIILTDGQGNKLTANTMEYFPLLASALARGQVEFEGNSGLQLVADLMRFEIDTSNLLGEGNIVMSDSRGYQLRSNEIRYNFDAREGEAKNIVITRENHPGRVVAAEARIAPFGYRLVEVSYTTCHQDDPDWILNAQSFTVDENKVVTARHATLRMFGVPVMYLPELSFTNSDERKSGFLSPSFTYISGRELSLETPVYLNLAPNYDAIVSPRYTSSRGIYTEVTGRWLFANASGNAQIGYTRDKKLEDSRGMLALENTLQISDRLRMEIEGEWVSDDSFPDDYLSGDQTAQRHYAQRIEMRYSEGEAIVGAKLLKFQTIKSDNEVVSPYDSLPGVYLQWQRNDPQLGVMVDTSVDYFVRGDNDPNEGLRTHSQAYVTRNEWLESTRLESELGVAGSFYSANDSNWKTLYASLQLRRAFTSELLLEGGARQLLIEPRIALGLVSAADFENVPLYDTGRVEFSADELYKVNSYNGSDRFEDTNLLAYGFSTRMLRPGSSDDLFSARIAQRYRFSDSKIRLSRNDTPPKRGFSNLVLEGKVKATSTSIYKGRLEWNPDLEKIEKVDFKAQLLPSSGNAYALHYIKDLTDNTGKEEAEAKLSFYQLLGRNWQMTGDITYSIDDSKISKVLSGVRYISTCRCWNMEVYAEREPLTVGNRTYYYFQLNLLGIGELGSDRFGDTVARLKEEI